MNQKGLLKRIARQFIPNAGTIVLVIVLLWAQQAGALGFLAPDAASTSTISYQGRLADNSGNPVTNAGLGMTFRLYNAATGGSALWTETYSGVPVNNGLFHVLLGSVTPIPASLFSSNNTLYLGIKVGADSEMTPREQLASAPYAMQASQALTVPDGSVTTAKVAARAITSAKLGLDTPNLIQSGAVAGSSELPGWNLNTGTGTRRFRKSVTFPTPYSNVPQVIVSLQSMDDSNLKGTRIQIGAENITVSGFEMVMSTWADSIVYGMIGTWTAIGSR